MPKSQGFCRIKKTEFLILDKVELRSARDNQSDVIVLGASREGMLQQAVHGDIPAAISRNSQQTVILVRAASAIGTGKP
ncbi:universal stress protein [Nostoc sp. T09]|uniref:universal stress protein n=1 Tax=Nostoc sp. T09 TaxID=1932621 RepID=UPI00118058D1|nr:universal stress protein [Nostoc sp. T09]